MGDLAINLIKMELHRLPDTIRSFSRRCFCEQLHHLLSLGLTSPCYLDSSEGYIFIATSHRLSFDVSLIYVLLSIFRAIVSVLTLVTCHLECDRSFQDGPCISSPCFPVARSGRKKVGFGVGACLCHFLELWL